MDETSFKKLFDMYLHPVHDYIAMICKSDYIAEEVTQELFIILWRKRNDLHHVQHMDQYIFRIARNLAIKLLKRAAMDSRLAAQFYMQTSQNEEGPLHFNNTQHLITQAVMALPPQPKRIYLLSRRDNMNYDEMAAVTGLSRNTVKNHLQKALVTIREHLVKNGYQPLVAVTLIRLLS